MKTLLFVTLFLAGLSVCAIAGCEPAEGCEATVLVSPATPVVEEIPLVEAPLVSVVVLRRVALIRRLIVCRHARMIERQECRRARLLSPRMVRLRCACHR